MFLLVDPKARWEVTDLLEVTACPAVQPVILSLELGVLNWGCRDAPAQPDYRYTHNYSSQEGSSRLSLPGAGVSFENTQLRCLKGTRSLPSPLDGAISPAPSARRPIYKINTIQRLPKPHHIIATRSLPLKIAIWGN